MAAVSMSMITTFAPATDAVAQTSRPLTLARFVGLRAFSIRSHIKKANVSRTAAVSRRMKISCAVAAPATLETVREIIAKQLSLDVSDVKAESQFSELGADSLDTVEIMMSLEENFNISLGEEGAEKIVTVQDAADLIEAGVQGGN